LVLWTYFPTLQVPFLSDDLVLLTDAQHTRYGLSIFEVNPQWFFYRPLLRLIWTVMFDLWSTWAVGYHLLSIILHWLNSLLVIVLVRRGGAGGAIAIVSGLLFALLPLHVEAVTWLAVQYDLLATLWYLSTLLCLLLAWQMRSPWMYALSLVTYQLSLWSKETSFTLPLAVVALALLLPRRPRWWLVFASVLPHSLLLALNLVQRYLAWGSFGGYPGEAPQHASVLWDHLASALAVMIGPLNRLVFPAWFVQLWMLGMAVLLLAGLMSGRNQRLILLSLVWIVITSFPALTILPVGADLQNSRLLYLPSVGFSVGLAALLQGVAERYLPRHHRPMFAGCALVVGLAYFAVLPAQIHPWIVAGQVSLDVVDQLHRFVPAFAPGSRLQVVGLPDNYKGAYIYRLGLDHAYGRRYGSLFQLEAVSQLQPFSDDPQRDHYQVAFAFDPVTTRWVVVQARGITVPGVDQAFPPGDLIASWDFTKCGVEAEWAFSDLRASCVEGEGLRLDPESDDPYMMNQVQAAGAARWVHVIADVSILDGPVEQLAAQVYWEIPGMHFFEEQRSVTLERSSEPVVRRLHFYLPPDVTGQGLSRLRLDPVNRRHPVLIRHIVASALPSSD
jgi:protein O-mannosyl-transferase